MNGLNRTVVIVLALLLIAIPMVLLLLQVGVVPGDTVVAVVAAVLAPVRRFVAGELNRDGRLMWFVVFVLLMLLSLVLLLRELTFGRRVAQVTTLSSAPGEELKMTATAVEHLIVGAAREAGAVDAAVYLTSNGNRYDVACDIVVPSSANFAQLAAGIHEHIKQTLQRHHVPTGSVVVTITRPQLQKGGRTLA